MSAAGATSGATTSSGGGGGPAGIATGTPRISPPTHAAMSVAYPASVPPRAPAARVTASLSDIPASTFMSSYSTWASSRPGTWGKATLSASEHPAVKASPRSAARSLAEPTATETGGVGGGGEGGAGASSKDAKSPNSSSSPPSTGPGPGWVTAVGSGGCSAKSPNSSSSSTAAGAAGAASKSAKSASSCTD